MLYRFVAVLFCAMLLTACGHGSLSPSTPIFVGKWITTLTIPGTTVIAQKTFDFRAGGEGAFSLVSRLDQSSEKFRWNQDGHAVNVAYTAQPDHPAQTDHIGWSVSDDGTQLTLTEDSGTTVFQKSP